MEKKYVVAGMLAAGGGLGYLFYRLFQGTPDAGIAGRVRSRLNRFLTQPGGVEVSCRDGVVTLSGDILAQELDRCVSLVSQMTGVQSVANRLRAHMNGHRAVPRRRGNIVPV
jgi:hypothetical protein